MPSSNKKSIIPFFPAFNFGLVIIESMFGCGFVVAILQKYRINYVYIIEIDYKTWTFWIISKCFYDACYLDDNFIINDIIFKFWPFFTSICYVCFIIKWFFSYISFFAISYNVL